MLNNLLDKLGDWNPQLLRELKGRIKVLPVIITLATSLISQLILFLYQLNDSLEASTLLWENTVNCIHFMNNNKTDLIKD